MAPLPAAARFMGAPGSVGAGALPFLALPTPPSAPKKSLLGTHCLLWGGSGRPQPYLGSCRTAGAVIKSSSRLAGGGPALSWLPAPPCKGTPILVAQRHRVPPRQIRVCRDRGVTEPWAPPPGTPGSVAVAHTFPSTPGDPPGTPQPPG